MLQFKEFANPDITIILPGDKPKDEKTLDFLIEFTLEMSMHDANGIDICRGTLPAEYTPNITHRPNAQGLSIKQYLQGWDMLNRDKNLTGALRRCLERIQNSGGDKPEIIVMYVDPADDEHAESILLTLFEYEKTISRKPTKLVIFHTEESHITSAISDRIPSDLILEDILFELQDDDEDYTQRMQECIDRIVVNPVTA